MGKILYASKTVYQCQTSFSKALALIINGLLFFILILIFFAMYKKIEEQDTVELLFFALLFLASLFLFYLLFVRSFKPSLILYSDRIVVKRWAHRPSELVKMYHFIPLELLKTNPIEVNCSPFSLPNEEPGFHCSALIRKSPSMEKEIYLRGFAQDPVGFLEALKQTILGEQFHEYISLAEIAVTMASRGGYQPLYDRYYKNRGLRDSDKKVFELLSYFHAELISLVGESSEEEPSAFRERKEQFLVFLETLKEHEKSLN
jgi:hypothetical protein